jgi:predicted RNA-binding protein with TRAM domain
MVFMFREESRPVPVEEGEVTMLQFRTSPVRENGIARMRVL